ncbi:MAG: protein phosphatase 2C domain-containing protein [Bacteroidota bacterium]
MHIDSHLQIGHFHTNFCEDFLLIESPDPSLTLAAIMDGCSMGKDSQFAAALFAKMLRKIITVLPYEAMHDPSIPTLDVWSLPALGEEILRRLWQDLRSLKDRLFLDQLELLCTLHFALVRPANREVWHVLVGDGMYEIDGELVEVDQGNRPDYLAYHLSKGFDSWFANQELAHFSLQSSFGMASDGIVAFEKMKPGQSFATEEVPGFLFQANADSSPKYNFRKKLRQLEEEGGLVPTDDLSLIQFAW